MAFLLVYYSYDVTSDENAILLHCLISRKDYCLQTQWVTSALCWEERVKPDKLCRNIMKHYFNKMVLLLPFNTQGHNSPWWVHCLSHFKMNWIWSPSDLLPFPIPAEAIMAHLSSCTGSDMSSNYLAFGVLGVIVSYEIKSDAYWQCG